MFLCFAFALMMDLFLTNIQLYASQDVNWWTGVMLILLDYCDAFNAFIICLDSHSDGTHSLQRIHCWASDVMLNFSKSVQIKQKKLAWGSVNFQQIFISVWTVPLRGSKWSTTAEEELTGDTDFQWFWWYLHNISYSLVMVSGQTKDFKHPAANHTHQPHFL